MKTLAFNLAVSIILCTIIIGALIAYESRKSKRKNEEANNKFWDRENQSNFARKKDISSLNYIEVAFDSFPKLQTDSYEIKTCLKELYALQDKKILNLSGISNTDLKLSYGVANLPVLSEYDNNYSQLIKTLSNLGFHLSKEGFHAEAVFFLEYAIELGSDLSRTFYSLADEYQASGDTNKLLTLIEKAKALDSTMASSIVNNLSARISS